MKKVVYLITLLIIVFSLSGCFLDPYKNEKYGKLAIESWFNYKNDKDDLGKTRRRLEKISTIEGTVCEFITKYKSNYIFNCTISYKELGETVIPFSNNKEKSLYTVVIPLKDNKITYKIYNSSSEKNIWEKDKELK